jgi:hypothetical protein
MGSPNKQEGSGSPDIANRSDFETARDALLAVAEAMTDYDDAYDGEKIGVSPYNTLLYTIGQYQP